MLVQQCPTKPQCISQAHPLSPAGDNDTECISWFAPCFFYSTLFPSFWMLLWSKVFSLVLMMPRHTRTKIRSVSDVCSHARASKATVVRSQRQWAEPCFVNAKPDFGPHTCATTFVLFSENDLSTPSSGWKTYLPRNFCPSLTITSAFSLSYLLSCSIYTSFQLLLRPPVIKSHSAQTVLAQANILNLNVELGNSTSHGF